MILAQFDTPLKKSTTFLSAHLGPMVKFRPSFRKKKKKIIDNTPIMKEKKTVHEHEP